MSYEIQLLLWGVAVCLPVMLNIMTKRVDAVGLSAMLLLTWCFGRITAALYSPPESMTFYPLVDAACGVTAFAAWVTRRAWWKLALTGLFGLQLALHASYWVSWVIDPTDKAALYTYVLANNLVFASELLLVGGGALVDVARGIGHGMLDRARAVRHVAHGP